MSVQADTPARDNAVGGHLPWIGRAAKGGRLRLVQGPIDIILDLKGPEDAVRAAEARAVMAFEGLLEQLVAELPVLRTPVGQGALPQGQVARAMASAVAPFRPDFITPMAAVAGAVADHILAAVTAESGLDSAAVNNGGDVALWLKGTARYRVGIADGRPGTAPLALIGIGAGDGIGGIATSGWRGRSHSLGIADAVTVLARTAAGADAAATMIANAVDLPGHSGIIRRPARDLAPDSDLGTRPVTVDVGPLTPGERARALDAGEKYAAELIGRGLARAIFLSLQDEVRSLGADLPAIREEKR
ncbi:UPF0280 family protein [Defluviimonas aestuarii]|uniref:UPF0280 family protein n=1 Tax=Albidovulum aestuarii TaxID=1130726 RepID=UPI00249B6159|nr:UPF0280 family protein [Defluviimonas aestuarii]MDI3336081.1 UPF0280 family protein [Defluviimonas aestuarii]